VLVTCAKGTWPRPAGAATTPARQALAVQAWLETGSPLRRLVVVTRARSRPVPVRRSRTWPAPRPVAVFPRCGPPQQENPAPFSRSWTSTRWTASRAALAGAGWTSEEPQLALRDGSLQAPRMVRVADAHETLLPPADSATWRWT